MPQVVQGRCSRRPQAAVRPGRRPLSRGRTAFLLPQHVRETGLLAILCEQKSASGKLVKNVDPQTLRSQLVGSPVGLRNQAFTHRVTEILAPWAAHGLGPTGRHSLYGWHGLCTQKHPHCLLLSCCCLGSASNYEQEAPHFHCTMTPANGMSGPVPTDHVPRNKSLELRP